MSDLFDDKPRIPGLNDDYNEPDPNRVHTRLRDKEANNLIELRKAYRLALAELLQKNPMLAERLSPVQRKELENLSRHQILHYLIQYGFRHRGYLGRLVARMVLEHITDLDMFEEKHGIDIVNEEFQKRIYAMNYAEAITMQPPATKKDIQRMQREDKKQKRNKD